MTDPAPDPAPEPHVVREHVVSWDTRGSYTRVRCTCRWAFQSPDAEAARVAAHEHVEAHSTPRDADPVVLLPEHRPTPWPTSRAHLPLGGLPIHELALAAVEVNQLARCGHVHAEDAREDVAAVLLLTAEHEAAAVKAMRYGSHVTALRSVLTDLADVAHLDPADALAELGERWRAQLGFWEGGQA